MRRSVVFKAALLCVLAGVFLAIIVPKETYHHDGEGVLQCTCFGSEFLYGTKCLGFAVNCTYENIVVHDDTCTIPTCEDIIERLRVVNQEFSQDLEARINTDIVVVIDASNSMEGERIAAAKNAARMLVDNLDSGERMGIVSFNHEAHEMHGFSDDKESLHWSIDEISLQGGTMYLPALLAAEKVFVDQGRESKRGIIFLSDGIPHDRREDILAKTRQLKSEGILLFTIGFGIEKEEGEVLILEEMVSETLDEEELAARYREFSDEELLVTTFVEAWEELVNVRAISIIPTFEEASFFADETSRAGFEVLMDSLLLTPEQYHEESLCTPQLRAWVVSESTGEEVVLLPRNNKFVFPEGGLSAGLHNLSVFARLDINQGAACSFTGESSIKDFLVKEVVERECRPASCEEALEALEDFDFSLEKGATLPRERGYGRVAIVLDVSESMRSVQRDVVRGTDRLNRLLSLGDQRALITFANESHLVVPLTRDKDSFSKALEGLHPQGTTMMLPVLVKARFLLQGEREGDVVVIISDGIVHDAQGRAGVLAEARTLVDEGVCVFVLGYGADILRDREQEQLFKEMTRYSQRRLGCGAYAHTPESKELSMLVTEMFGGRVRDDEELRVVVDRSRSSEPGSFRFLVDAVSMKTGLSLPVEYRGACLPAPVIESSLLRRGEIVTVSQESFSDGSLVMKSSYLFPGRYSLVASAHLPIDGCDISGSVEKEFVILGPPGATDEFAVMAFSLLLVIGLFFTTRSLLRKEED